jgi:hypothetical protein
VRKRLITPGPQEPAPCDEGWLGLGRAAVVEVTSEEKEHPVESALVSGEIEEWRAADLRTHWAGHDLTDWVSFEEWPMRITLRA